MERLLGITFRGGIPNILMRQRTKVTDAVHMIPQLKWN